MATTTLAAPEEAEATWVTGTQILGLPSAAFLRALAGNWIGNRVAKAPVILHVGCQHYKQQVDPLHNVGSHVLLS